MKSPTPLTVTSPPSTNGLFGQNAFLEGPQGGLLGFISGCIEALSGLMGVSETTDTSPRTVSAVGGNPCDTMPNLPRGEPMCGLAMQDNDRLEPKAQPIAYTRESIEALLAQRTPGQRLDLRGAHLAGLNLAGLDLSGVDLTGADLSNADLTGASLKDANLMKANLKDANLTDAVLTRATLTGTNFTKANMTRANLTHCNLIEAILIMANLTEAFLNGANLTGVTLTKTDLRHSLH